MKPQPNADSGTGFQRLDETKLELGDIILVTTPAKLSKVIRIATASDISHAMVYAAHCSVIDATTEGVHAGNTQRLFLDANLPVHVLRMRGGLTPTQLEAICVSLRVHIGTRYSVKQAALTPIAGSAKGDQRQFCSRLVAQAFAAAGIKLVPNPDFCSPEALKNSRLLDTIPAATVRVTEAELAFWSERADVPQLMRDSTNTVFNGARKRDPRIETFEDINVHVARHPEHDEEFCDLFMSSGFMSIWRIEIEKNPWQYELSLMEKAPRDRMAIYCTETLENDKAAPNRFLINLATYQSLAGQFDRRFFRMMAELYRHLSTLHQQRMTVARIWLLANPFSST